jgi:hypothetical protein
MDGWIDRGNPQFSKHESRNRNGNYHNNGHLRLTVPVLIISETVSSSTIAESMMTAILVMTSNE